VVRDEIMWKFHNKKLNTYIFFQFVNTTSDLNQVTYEKMRSTGSASLDKMKDMKATRITALPFHPSHSVP